MTTHCHIDDTYLIYTYVMLRRIEKVDTEGFFSSFGGRFCIKLFPQIPLKMTFIVMCNVLYTVQCTIYCTLNLTEYIGLPSAVKVTLHSVQFINSNGAGAAVEINKYYQCFSNPGSRQEENLHCEHSKFLPIILS